jgi:hypothetical protein
MSSSHRALLLFRTIQQWSSTFGVDKQCLHPPFASVSLAPHSPRYPTVSPPTVRIAVLPAVCCICFSTFLCFVLACVTFTCLRTELSILCWYTPYFSLKKQWHWVNYSALALCLLTSVFCLASLRVVLACRLLLLLCSAVHPPPSPVTSVEGVSSNR